MEPNQINIFSPAVLRDFEEIEDTQKPRCLCQGVRDIRETNRFDGIHHNRSVVHRITAADLHMGTHPDPNTACDFSTANPVAQTFGENHGSEFTENLKPRAMRGKTCCY